MDEKNTLRNAYQISGTLNTIRRLKRKFPDNLEETNCDEMIEDVKKVYSVLKKAIDNYPDDTRIKEWKDLIQEIENEMLSLHLDKYKQTFNESFPTFNFMSQSMMNFQNYSLKEQSY